MDYIEQRDLSREQKQVQKFLEVFFSAEVKFVKDSTRLICAENNICYEESDRRQSYTLSKNQRLVVVYEHHDTSSQKAEKKELFRILIDSELSSEIPSVYYDNTSVIISEFFNNSRNKTFIDFYDFNSIDVLSKTLASYMLATTAFKKGYIFSWLEKLEKLSNATFEGNYFSTGFIFTRRMKQVLNSKNKAYGCIPALKSFPIIDFQNDYKRYWYLVDGDRNYYISDKKENLNYIVMMNGDQDFFGRYFLDGFISGQDIVFRSLGHGELSIVNKKRIEIIKRENEWKIRSIDSMINFFKDNCLMNNETAKAICYYILQCSRRHNSSIFWIPKNENNNAMIDELITQKENLKNNDIYITSSENEQLLLRIFTSDGANIISRSGKVLFCGAIVNMKMVECSGMKGTGESAAEILGNHGISVKVSQDGKIKIHKNGKKIFF